MKKVIPFVIVAVAMALPLVLEAESPWLLLDNRVKTLYLEAVDDQIDEGDITFQTPQYKSQFQAGITGILAARDMDNWQAVIDGCNALRNYTQYYIVGDVSDMVDNILEVTAAMYGVSGYAGVRLDKHRFIMQAIEDENLQLNISIEGTIHFAGCDSTVTTLPDGTTIKTHQSNCTRVDLTLQL